MALTRRPQASRLIDWPLRELPLWRRRTGPDEFEFLPGSDGSASYHDGILEIRAPLSDVSTEQATKVPVHRS